MIETTEILISKTTLAGDYNHIQVAEQKFVEIDGQKEAFGQMHRYIIECGNTALATEKGLDKIFNLPEIWSAEIISKWEND